MFAPKVVRVGDGWWPGMWAEAGPQGTEDGQGWPVSGAWGDQGGSSWPRAGGRPPPQSRGTDTGGACGQRWAGGLAGTWKGLACRLYQEQVHSQALPDPLLGQKRDCRASPFHPDPAITGAPAHCHPSAGRWEAGSGGPGTSSDQEVRGPPQEPESSRHAASGLKAQALRVTDNQINQAQFPGKERPLRPA